MNREYRGRSLGKTIHHISRGIHWMVKHQLDEYGVGSGQHFFLFLVDQQPGITQNEVSRKTDIDKATAAKGICRLEERGYIRRVPDQKDRRVRHLYLTERGKEIIPTIRNSFRKVTEICSAELTSGEQEQLFLLLHKVDHSLSTYIETRRGPQNEQN